MWHDKNDDVDVGNKQTLELSNLSHKMAMIGLVFRKRVRVVRKSAADRS
jgi:hypothetical protein